MIGRYDYEYIDDMIMDRNLNQSMFLKYNRFYLFDYHFYIDQRNPLIITLNDKFEQIMTKDLENDH